LEINDPYTAVPPAELSQRLVPVAAFDDASVGIAVAPDPRLQTIVGEINARQPVSANSPFCFLLDFFFLLFCCSLPDRRISEKMGVSLSYFF
jgi:hypothetical protein